MLSCAAGLCYIDWRVCVAPLPNISCTSRILTCPGSTIWTACLQQAKARLQTDQAMIVFRPGLQAIHTYQSLNAFLNGDSPHYMLPTTPRGYIVSRLRELGKGSCLQVGTAPSDVNLTITV